MNGIPKRENPAPTDIGNRAQTKRNAPSDSAKAQRLQGPIALGAASFPAVAKPLPLMGAYHTSPPDVQRDAAARLRIFGRRK